MVTTDDVQPSSVLHTSKSTASSCDSMMPLFNATIQWLPWFANTTECFGGRSRCDYGVKPQSVVQRDASASHRSAAATVTHWSCLRVRFFFLLCTSHRMWRRQRGPPDWCSRSLADGNLNWCHRFAHFSCTFHAFESEWFTSNPIL